MDSQGFEAAMSSVKLFGSRKTAMVATATKEPRWI